MQTGIIVLGLIVAAVALIEGFGGKKSGYVFQGIVLIVLLILGAAS